MKLFYSSNQDEKEMTDIKLICHLCLGFLLFKNNKTFFYNYLSREEEEDKFYLLGVLIL